MQALTVTPMRKHSLALLDIPDPEPTDADLLVEGLAVGVCGGWWGLLAAGRTRTAPRRPLSPPACS